MQTVQELHPQIIEWAEAKNIKNPDTQFLKILEEVGETAKAILQEDRLEILDGIGDIAVTIMIYYWQKEKNLNVVDFRNYKLKDSKMFVLFIKALNDEDFYIFDELSSIAKVHNTTLTECLNMAWSEIKDRKGKTVDGNFIKN